MSNQTETNDYIDARTDDYLEQLFELLEQPSISTTGEGVEECASLLIELCEAYGFDVSLLETTSNPIVYAERLVDESKPTVVFYGHYDVQPPGDDELWDSPAFEPTIRDDSIYARGAGDNKGQLVTHIFATEAVAETDDLGVNVKLLIEGEEENGSTGLIDFLEDEPSVLDDCDLVYVADGPMHQSGRPTLIYGNRGILSVELRLREANTDLHSGNFGGPIPNAAWSMLDLLESMREDDGRVAIDGFYDDVEITDADRAAVDEIPLESDELRSQLDLEGFTVEEADYYERLLLEPTLTINGLESGYTGTGKKTIIPHEAIAKLDMRLVPEQDPDVIFERISEHVRERRPDVEITKQGTFPPMKTSLETPLAAPVYESLAEVWDDEPVELPLLGGSLPAAYLKRAADVPVLVVPYANPDQGNHSPNEHLDVDCFVNGIKTTAAVLGRLEDVSK